MSTPRRTIRRVASSGLIAFLALTLTGCTSSILDGFLAQLGFQRLERHAGVQISAFVLPGACTIFPSPLGSDGLGRPFWRDDDELSLDGLPGWLSVATSRSAAGTERRLCSTASAPVVHDLPLGLTYMTHTRIANNNGGPALHSFDVYLGTLQVSTVAPLSVSPSATPAAIGPPGILSSHLMANASGGAPPYAFAWRPREGLSFGVTGPNSPVADALPPVTTTYTVTVIDSLGLTASGSVTVTVFVGPVVSIDAVPSIINSGEVVPLVARVTGGTPPYAFSWSPVTGLDNPTRQDPRATATSTTTYTVRVTDLLGSTSVASVELRVRQPLTVSAQATPDTIAAGQSSQLLATGQGGVRPFHFAWVPATGLSAVDISNPQATPTQTTTYTVTVTDAVGTTATASTTVTVAPTGSTADLAVTVADSADPVRLGDSVTYTVTITNRGSSAATGVVLTDTLPITFEINEGIASQGACTLSFGLTEITVTCALGTLPVGATATVTLPGFMGNVGTMTTTATVAANEADPDPTNNTAVEATTVLPR